MRNQNERGFSLIELLIVVAIILIIAAIAIPNLIRARIAANESSAAASVRTLVGAEVTYAAAYPDNGYTDLASLGGTGTCAPSSTSACIIDGEMTAGIKSGYQFSAVGLNPAGTANTWYLINAWPLTVNTSGVKAFCAAEDNVTRSKTPSPGTATRNTCLTYGSIGN